MFQTKIGRSEREHLALKLDFIMKKMADLENPLKFNVGDKVKATGKGTLNHLTYEGDIIDTWHKYSNVSTSNENIDDVVRINGFKIYNTRSKTIHEITDNNFNFELVKLARLI